MSISLRVVNDDTSAARSATLLDVSVSADICVTSSSRRLTMTL